VSLQQGNNLLIQLWITPASLGQESLAFRAGGPSFRFIKDFYESVGACHDYEKVSGGQWHLSVMTSS